MRKLCMRFLPMTHRTEATPGVHIKFRCVTSEKLRQTLHSLPEAALPHSCRMFSFYCLPSFTPHSQPTMGHQWRYLAVNSPAHKFKNLMGQTLFRTTSPFLKKEKGGLLPSVVITVFSQNWIWQLGKRAVPFLAFCVWHPVWLAILISHNDSVT